MLGDDVAGVIQGLALPKPFVWGQLNPTWHADELPPWAESKAQFDPRIAEHFFSFRAHPWRETLQQIQCPTLLLTGDPEAGAIVTPAGAEEAVALMAPGQVAHIAGTGHNIHREGYEETLAAVREFLDGVTGRETPTSQPAG